MKLHKCEWKEYVPPAKPVVFYIIKQKIVLEIVPFF